MHPLAILVVWTFLDFERVKVEKKWKKKFWLIFSKYWHFSPASASNLKLREKGQMVPFCRSLARGYPLGWHFWNFWAILAKTNLKNQKIVQKNAYYSQNIHSNCTKIRLRASLATLINIVVQCRIAPGTLERVIAAQISKIWKNSNFLSEKVIFDPNFEFSRENGTRDLFLYRNFGAACKRGGKSYG